MVARLLTFFLGVPLLALIVIFLPHEDHLVFNCVVILASALGAAEFAQMLRSKKFPVSTGEALFLGAVLPAAVLLAVSFEAAFMWIVSLVTLAPLVILVRYVFVRRAGDEKSYENAISWILAALAVFVYPGLFVGWVILINQFPHSTTLLIVYLLTVIANDSFAWLFGMLFGKNNRGIFPASPSKSIAGFAGGMLASVGVCVAGVLLDPEAFVPEFFSAPVSGVLLGLACGLAAILGDLAESVLKRSCGVKDSGLVIPGRGGILDSIDSHVIAAPVFYLLFRFLFY